MNSAILKTHILVVEDVSFMRMLVIQALESMGFANVYEAGDGEEAINFLKKSSVDLIISDIEMRPMNGLDLIKHVRAGETPLPRGIPAIILSGLDDTSTLSAAAELDVHGFLEKPVSAVQLRERVEEAMNAEVQLRDADFYRHMVFAPAYQEVQQEQVADSGYTVTHTAPSRSSAAPASEQHTRNNEATNTRTDTNLSLLIPLDKLQPGMVLQEDIIARDRLLMKKGIVLSPGHILVLRNMRSVLNRADIQVYTP